MSCAERLHKWRAHLQNGAHLKTTEMKLNILFYIADQVRFTWIYTDMKLMSGGYLKNSIVPLQFG